MPRATPTSQLSTSTCIKWIRLYADYLALYAKERASVSPEIFAVLPRYYFVSQLELMYGYGRGYTSGIIKRLDAVSARHNLSIVDFVDDEIRRDRIVRLLQDECSTN